MTRHDKNLLRFFGGFSIKAWTRQKVRSSKAQTECSLDIRSTVGSSKAQAETPLNRITQQLFFQDFRHMPIYMSLYVLCSSRIVWNVRNSEKQSGSQERERESARKTLYYSTMYFNFSQNKTLYNSVGVGTMLNHMNLCVV